jgi:hypothetical protein
LTGRLSTAIRSTWDYHHQREEFVDCAERVGGRTQLWNPAPVVRWNSHKGYLLGLAAAGVPVVPTVLLRQGAPANLAEITSERGWTRVVVKPAVSASSYRTLHADAETLDEGDAHLRELLAERDVLVQPYISSVEDYGERAVIWIDGHFTHAVRKSPRFSADDEVVSGALPIAEDERLVAERALAFVTEPLLRPHRRGAEQRRPAAGDGTRAHRAIPVPVAVAGRPLAAGFGHLRARPDLLRRECRCYT